MAVIDADIVVRELQQPGQFVYRKIVKNFGSQILERDGQINRKKLADIVFKDTEKRLLLNKITHSAVNKIMIEQCIKLGFGLQQSHGLPKDCVA